MPAAIGRGSRTIAAVLLSSAFLAAPCLAQPMHAQPVQYNRPPQGQQPPRPPSIEQIIGELRARVRPTPSQQPAFNAFANVMRENEREAARIRPPSQNSDAVQVLSAQLRFADAEAAGLRRLLPALQHLYAELSPAQRQQANLFFRQGPGQGPGR